MEFFEYKSQRIAYRLIGACQNPLVMFAHPLGLNQSVWDALIAPLVSHYRILTWDLPGHGLSSPWPKTTEPLTAKALAAICLALAEIAEAEQFHFVGTSIGGVIGQELIHHHCHTLISATLTNTGATIGTAEAWHARAAAIRRQGTATMAGEIVPRWFGPHSQQQNPQLVAGWSQALVQCDDESYAALCDMLASVNYGKPDTLPPRTAIIAGADDLATPPAKLFELAHLLSMDEPLVLDKTGHVPSIETSAKLLDLIKPTITQQKNIH